MAVTFKGTTVGKERGQSAQTFPRHRRKAASSVLHTLSGGNRVQHSGKSADTLPLVLRCTESQLNTLYSDVATSGTLAYSGGSRSAFLDEVDPQEVSAGKDVFFVTATFILT